MQELALGLNQSPKAKIPSEVDRVQQVLEDLNKYQFSPSSSFAGEHQLMVHMGCKYQYIRVIQAWFRNHKILNLFYIYAKDLLSLSHYGSTNPYIIPTREYAPFSQIR